MLIELALKLVYSVFSNTYVNAHFDAKSKKSMPKICNVAHWLHYIMQFYIFKNSQII